MWAQRNWMQTAPVQQVTTNTPAAPTAVVKPTEPAKQASAPENTADSNTPDSAQPADSANTAKAADNSQPSQHADQSSKIASPGNPSNTVNTHVALDTPASPIAEQALNTASTGEPVVQTSGTIQSEQSMVNVEVDAADTRPQLKTTAQLKAEAVLAQSSTVQVRADATPGQGSSPAGNAVQAQLNQQLAPQTAAQIAQQAQALGEGLSESIAEEGLKVGQKILAAGNLQSTGTATGIAAGTNGLTGTAGSAQPALIKTPVNQPGFAKELGQTVQWAIGKNLSTVDIRVNPESFGPMNMRLVQKGQQVQLVIRTQDEASANLLTQALGGLKEVLAQNGLQLNQVQIQHGNTPTPQGQANNGQAQFDQNRNQGQGSGQHAAGGDNSQPESGTPATTATSRKPEGKLDLFA